MLGSYSLTARLAFAGLLTAGLLAASATSAVAATGGTGAFNSAAHINPPPAPPCATYSLYNAHLTFSDGSTFTTSSDPNPLSPNFQWGEIGDGTHHPQTSAAGTTSCTDTPGQSEQGFTGTLTQASGVCNLAGGSYARTDTTVQYNFTSGQRAAGSGTCPLAITAHLKVLQTFNPPLYIGPIEIDDLTACNSIIAPTSCVLVDGSY